MFFMGRTTKKDRPPSLMRGVLASNLVRQRDRLYASLPTVTARNKKIAEVAGTTHSQIQRIINQELGCSIDLLDGLAAALECKPENLLTPYWASAKEQKQGAGPEVADPASASRTRLYGRQGPSTRGV